MIDVVRERAELSALRSPETYISRLQCIVRNVCCKEARRCLGCPPRLARLWYFRAGRRLLHSCAADEVLAAVTVNFSVTTDPVPT